MEQMVAMGFLVPGFGGGIADRPPDVAEIFPQGSLSAQSGTSNSASSQKALVRPATQLNSLTYRRELIQEMRRRRSFLPFEECRRFGVAAVQSYDAGPLMKAGKTQLTALAEASSGEIIVALKQSIEKSLITAFGKDIQTQPLVSVFFSTRLAVYSLANFHLGPTAHSTSKSASC